MPLGGSNEKKTYLRIAFGKLRLKSDQTDSEAIKRTRDDGTEVYERVYGWVEGNLTGLYHKESDEYGNSFEVTLDDGKDKYQVSLPEGSNFFQDFLSKMPNVDLNKPIKIIPYDFEDKNTGKRKKGLTVMQDENKIENFFVSYDEEKKKFNYKNDFPEPEKPSGKMNKNDWKIYFIRVSEFLTEYAKTNIIPKIQNNFLNKLNQQIEEHSATEKENSDGLPF